jgi:hypothetical protein
VSTRHGGILAVGLPVRPILDEKRAESAMPETVSSYRPVEDPGRLSA